MNLEIHKLKAELDKDNFAKREEDSKTLASVLPQDTEWHIIQSTEEDSACLIFQVQAGLIIRSVILFSDKLFDTGSYVAYPSKSTNRISIPIHSDK